MAFEFGFYNSIDGDRTYDADQFGDLFTGLITDGVYASIGDALMTTPGPGLSVIVGTGRAWFNKTWNVNRTKMQLNLDLADLLLPRIDAVVLEVNKNSFSRTNSIKIITGTPSANPTRPGYSATNNVYQYPLAYIYVKANAEAIEAKDITVVVGQAPTNFVSAMLDTVDITTMYQHWEQQFSDWFADVQSQLEGDVVASLINRINQLDTSTVKIADKATEQDLIDKVPNKWIDSTLFVTSDANMAKTTGAILQSWDDTYASSPNWLRCPHNMGYASPYEYVNVYWSKNEKLRKKIGLKYNVFGTNPTIRPLYNYSIFNSRALTITTTNITGLIANNIYPNIRAIIMNVNKLQSTFNIVCNVPNKGVIIAAPTGNGGVNIADESNFVYASNIDMLTASDMVPADSDGVWVAGYRYGSQTSSVPIIAKAHIDKQNPSYNIKSLEGNTPFTNAFIVGHYAIYTLVRSMTFFVFSFLNMQQVNANDPNYAVISSFIEGISTTITQPFVNGILNDRTMVCCFSYDSTNFAQAHVLFYNETTQRLTYKKYPIYTYDGRPLKTTSITLVGFKDYDNYGVVAWHSGITHCRSAVAIDSSVSMYAQNIQRVDFVGGVPISFANESKIVTMPYNQNNVIRLSREPIDASVPVASIQQSGSCWYPVTRRTSGTTVPYVNMDTSGNGSGVSQAVYGGNIPVMPEQIPSYIYVGDL